MLCLNAVVRLLLKLGRACNNHCLFCHSPDPASQFQPLEQLVPKLDEAKRLGASMLVLSGGEPTLHPQLLPIAEHIKARGLGLGLVTNGRRLSDPSLIQALCDQGLSYVYLSLHAPGPALHDALVGARAFEQTWRALELLHGRVPELTVNTVVTPLNLSSLPQLVDQLAPYPRLKLKFSMPQPKGRALQRFDQVVPRLPEAARAVCQAIRYGQASCPQRSGFGHEGFPLCLMPGLEALHDTLRSQRFAFISEPEDAGFEPVDDALFCKPCAPCEHAAQCPGVHRGYVERRGTSELPMSPLQQASALAVTDEPRAWVRLTYACNNRCQFCLDRGAGPGTHRPIAELAQQIAKAREDGAQRLILSGGEATTHPQFLPLVRLGKRLGYRWVQVITNGRMFSYPELLQRSIEAGLNEVTFSVHGHCAELHDKLVGVPGAFAQVSSALQSALRQKNLVVSVDVVVTSLNIPVLTEMLECFHTWGAREFDLLQLVPFGGAWEPEHRHLFVDWDRHLPELQRAIRYAREKGLTLWLNRFPPQLAEGFEELISEPKKLHDEVRGRKREFWRLVQQASPLACKEPERCQRCPIEGFCSAIETVQAQLAQGVLSHLTLHADALPSATLPPVDLLKITATDVHQARALLSRVKARRVRLRLERLDGLDTASSIGGAYLEGLELTGAEQLGPARALGEDALLVVDGARMPLGAIEAWQKASVRVEGVAPCLTSGLEPVWSKWFDARSLDAHGRLDPERFVDDYNRSWAWVKSRRCQQCSEHARCQGMHIDWVRAYGFAKLTPR